MQIYRSKITKEVLVDELEGHFRSIKKLIEDNNNLHPTRTLTTTFLKPAGVENPYVQFGYVQQTICKHTRVQVSGSINAYQFDANKKIKQ